MAREFEIKLRVDANGKSAVTEVNRVGQSLDGLGKKAKDQESRINALSGGFTALGRAAGAALAAIGFGSLAAGLGSVARETETLQRNMLRTEAMIRATGEAAGFTAQQLHDQAAALALSTLQSTEGVMSAQQVLLSFKSVAGETFTRTMELAADMSTVFQQDLKSSVTQLGKALEDPVKGLSALARVGVSFSESQKAVIQGFVDAGDAASAQAVILDVLATQMGGVAKAEALGMAGAFDTLGQRVQEAKIAIGEYTNITERVAGVVNGVAESVNRWTQALKAGDYDGYVDTFVGMAGAIGGIALAYTAAIVAVNLKSAALLALTAAQTAFNIAAKANPYYVLGALIAGAAGALFALRDRTIE
ncbi:MAG: hypothetical protein EOM91_24235, partial [Sphingobacteriia bacterium]|nr:hypothetical protein [Sphingobacteriia bacterium]